jgi:hypothetical protein
LSKRHRIYWLLPILGGGIALGILLILVLLNGAAASLGSWISDNPGCIGNEPYSNQMIEQMGRFRLPQSAREIVATSEAWQDCFVYVSFEFDSSDLPKFLESTFVLPPLTLTNHVLGFDNLPSELEWEFDADRNYLYGTGNNGNGEYQTVAVDTENPNSYVVYIITGLL